MFNDFFVFQGSEGPDVIGKDLCVELDEDAAERTFYSAVAMSYSAEPSRMIYHGII